MSDTGSAVGGFALIIGLFVAYALERRAARAKKNPSAPTEPAPVAAPAATSDHASPAASAPQGRSPNWGAPIVFCLLLFGAATHRHSFWGYLWQAIFLAFVAFGVYSTASKRDFEIDRKRDSELTRTLYVITTGVPYVFFPLLGWTMVVPFGLNAGVIVPALAWVPLIFIGTALVAVEKLKQVARRDSP